MGNSTGRRLVDPGTSVSSFPASCSGQTTSRTSNLMEEGTGISAVQPHIGKYKAVNCFELSFSKGLLLHK